MHMSKSQDKKFLIAAFPSAGPVGSFVISYLTSQLEMNDIGELEISEISPSYVIKKEKITDLFAYTTKTIFVQF